MSDFDPRDGTHITDLVLDEWLAGELAPEEHARVEAHLASCDRCSEKRAAYEAEHEGFLAQAPTLQRKPVASAPRARGKVSWLAAGAGVLAAAAALLVVNAGPGTEPPTTRLKGGPSVSFFIKHGEHVTRGTSGATVQPGDALRFTYSSTEPVHLALLGLDPRVASVYFPSGTHAVSVAAGRDVALEFSIELDDQPGEEQIHALFCKEPVELEPIRAGLAIARKLTAPSGCSAQRIVLHKAPAR